MSTSGEPGYIGEDYYSSTTTTVPQRVYIANSDDKKKKKSGGTYANNWGRTLTPEQIAMLNQPRTGTPGAMNQYALDNAEQRGRQQAEADAKKAADEAERFKKLLATMGLGGSGSSKFNRNPWLVEQAKMIQGQLNDGSYGKSYDALVQALGGQYDTAKTGINDNYNQLITMLQQRQTNPYEGMKFGGNITPATLGDFVKSQGGSADALQGRMMAEQQAADAAAAQFQSIANILGANQVAGNAGRLSDVDMARTQSLQGLDNSNLAFRAQIEAKRMEEAQRLQNLLITLAGQGVNLKGVK